MEDQVEEVKRKIEIVGVVGQYVALKKMGRHHKGLCPFHSEKTPSFLVNEELGLYKCFGCGAGGDVIKFLMEIEGIDFWEALQRLAERAGVKLVSGKNFKGSDKKQELIGLMELTAKYYHWLLTESKAGEEARRYLDKRGLSKKIIETFNLGYALPGWDNLTNYLVGKKGYKMEMLEKAGLVSKSSGGKVYDKFRGRIMFPLQDTAGKVVGFTGRILPDLAKETEPKYLNSPETEIYHKGRMLYGFFQAKQAIRESKRVVLVEGHMDMISSFAAGVSETVAVGGTALTEDQVEMMARLAETIYFSLDADTAGEAAIKRSVELAEKRGLEIKVVQIEGGKDPDEIARKSPRLWREMSSKGTDIYEFVMNRAFDKYAKSEVSGIKKITEEVIPYLAKIENAVIREVWVKKFAERLETEIAVVRGEVERFRSGRGFERVAEKAEQETETRSDKLGRRVVCGILSKPEYKELFRKWRGGLKIEGVMGKTLDWLMSTDEVEVTKLKDMVPAELSEYLHESYLLDEEVVEESAFKNLVANLLRETIREKRKVLIERMKSEGEKEKEEELVRELNDLDREESRLLVFLG